MKAAKVFVYDLHPHRLLADQLHEFLRADSDRSMQVEYHVWSPANPCSSPKRPKPAGLQVSPDLIVVILRAPSNVALRTFFDEIRMSYSEAPIIAVVDAGGPDAASQMLDHGASDFLIPPLHANGVNARVWRLLDGRRRENDSARQMKQKLGLEQFIGESPLFLAELHKIPAVAASDVSVLLEGETGTGKEIYARATHHLSSRANKPFIPVNCGALPTDLVENELFGHDAGAFTSAGSSSTGLIEEAAGGTLFLDEVDALPLLAQVKMLRFLQEKEYRPLGSRKMCKADVRVIAATNADLKEAVRAGRFRQDLYYRLNVIGVTLPPLRQRIEDIPLLVRHFLAKFSAQFTKPRLELNPATMQRLLVYDWPGNVRELENVIERAVVLSGQTNQDIQLPAAPTETNTTFQFLKAKAVAEFEQKYIRQALTQHGNVSSAARAAGKDRRAFWELMRKHQIKTPPTARRFTSLGLFQIASWQMDADFLEAIGQISALC